MGSEEMRIFVAFLATVSCCDIFQSDPSGNSLSVYDHISYFLDDCGQETAANSLKTILPVTDLILPNGYYRSWWSNTLDGAISFFDMWVNRNGNWYDVTNWSLKDGFSLVSFENVWYKLLKIAFKFPPQFESIESGKFDWELKEFGYKDFEGESSGLRGWGYRFYADTFFPEFADNDVINSIEQFLLPGWPVYALVVAILEGAWEQTGYHLLNLLTQFSYEILHGYYNTLYALIDGMVSKIETTLNIFSSSE